MQVFEQVEHHRHARLGVACPPPVDPTVFDAPVERIVGHMLDADGVEMNIECDDLVAVPPQKAIDVRPVWFDLFKLNFGADRYEPLGDSGGDGAFTGRFGARASVLWIHARYGDQRGEPVCQLLTIHCHRASFARVASTPMSEITSMWETTADAFAKRFDAIGDQWDASTPCEAWTVRELVDHVCEVQHNFGGSFGVERPAQYEWTSTREAMSAAFNTPGALEGTTEHPVLGELPKERLVAIAVADMLIHTWDLARAIGADETLPPEAVIAVHEGLKQLPPEIMRAPERFGDATDIPAGASPQDVMIAFTGRQP